MNRIMLFTIALAMQVACMDQPPRSTTVPAEAHRPQFHFSPKTSWMNDPNGMVYHNGIYHLFFQYHPDSTIWGPMHWGHATSRDLVHWEEQPIALYPDSLGTIFSGSAVVDKDNTAGFGNNALVAIFTHHNPDIAREKTGLPQYQSLAFSTDEGKTWTKYDGNPVLSNPGIRDFRDPKVMWHEESGRWIMTLATKQTITFYASADLKDWTRLSEFGEGIGAHGGVWECPDLISFTKEGKKVWVLIVNLNPGAPNGGSGGQYFIGDFDGKTFRPYDTDTRWLDFGRDNYAGITWSNTEDRRIFIGWMNNWEYANVVPTAAWRGATTLPRELSVEKIKDKWYLVSQPVAELSAITTPIKNVPAVNSSDSVSLKAVVESLPQTYRLDFSHPANQDFSVTLKNAIDERVTFGYIASERRYFVDRTQSGDHSFSTKFASVDNAPRISDDPEIRISMWVDVASIEVFADDGLTVMTEVFFPTKVYDDVVLKGGARPSFADMVLYQVSPTRHANIKN